MVFQSFGRLEPDKSQKYAWHCIVMDPTLRYKWSARGCVDRKHYICEVPAGRLGERLESRARNKREQLTYSYLPSAARRRKKSDPFAPQNQRLKPRKKGKKYSDKQERTDRRKKNRANLRRSWANQDNQQWVHGVKLGSRPPSKYAKMFARGSAKGSAGFR